MDVTTLSVSLDLDLVGSSEGLIDCRLVGVGVSSDSDSEEESMNVHKPSKKLLSLISLDGRAAKFADGSRSRGMS